MQNEIRTFHQQANHSRFHGQTHGHYESFFLRANHPTRPLAFWIRYTLFSPKDLPQQTLGELWAVFFNGETHQHVVVKQEFPLADCLFDTSAFRVRIGEAQLTSRHLKGAVESKGRALAWELTFAGDSTPVLLLPLNLYKGRFPAAKSLVSLPMARFDGQLSVNGKPMVVSAWLGSQNHNWGIRHTDLYAWGQVAGFDTHPDSFLEVATAKLRLGPFWTPPITPLVLRHRHKEYTCTGLTQALKAQGSFSYFAWAFRSGTESTEIKGEISAPRDAFVGLKYYNPPGGIKQCLNSKIARCRLQLRDRASGSTEVLETESRAAFEILTDNQDHGVEMSA
jgi:hypothetical protein